MISTASSYPPSTLTAAHSETLPNFPLSCVGVSVILMAT